MASPENVDRVTNESFERRRERLAFKAWAFLCEFDILHPNATLNEAIREAYARVPLFQGELNAHETGAVDRDLLKMVRRQLHIGHTSYALEALNYVIDGKQPPPCVPCEVAELHAQKAKVQHCVCGEAVIPDGELRVEVGTTTHRLAGPCFQTPPERTFE